MPGTLKYVSEYPLKHGRQYMECAHVIGFKKPKEATRDCHPTFPK